MKGSAKKKLSLALENFKAFSETWNAFYKKLNLLP